MGYKTTDAYLFSIPKT